MTKRLVAFLSLALLGASLLAANEQPAEPTTCEFSLQGEPAEPAITGPDNIVPLVYVVPQPDSPAEIVSVDFTGSFLDIEAGSYRWEPRAVIQVQNRSDQSIEDLVLSVAVATRGGGTSDVVFLPHKLSAGLLPGRDLTLSLGGSIAHGVARDDRVHILLSIHWVDFDGCRYIPSQRYPGNLEVQGPSAHERSIMATRGLR